VKVLITAGSTEVPIDKVRSIGNIFKGKTGQSIAEYFQYHREDVTLLTSARIEPEKLRINMSHNPIYCIRFRTFDELSALMQKEIQTGDYDVIIHSAAVSDYYVSNVLVPSPVSGNLSVVDANRKISSSHSKLFLELSPTPKLIDMIREPWGFKGCLVKFKLQVGISDHELLEIARKSMDASQANFIVANCLEWSREYAYILDADHKNSYEKVTRPSSGTFDIHEQSGLPAALYRRVQAFAGA